MTEKHFETPKILSDLPLIQGEKEKGDSNMANHKVYSEIFQALKTGGNFHGNKL
jgi:hypothetical protein